MKFCCLTQPIVKIRLSPLCQVWNNIYNNKFHYFQNIIKIQPAWGRLNDPHANAIVCVVGDGGGKHLDHTFTCGSILTHDNGWPRGLWLNYISQLPNEIKDVCSLYSKSHILAQAACVQHACAMHSLAIVITIVQSLFLSYFFSVFCFWPTSENLPCAKICFPQYFGITRRYMQKNIFVR